MEAKQTNTYEQFVAESIATKGYVCPANKWNPELFDKPAAKVCPQCPHYETDCIIYGKRRKAKPKTNETEVISRDTMGKSCDLCPHNKNCKHTEGLYTTDIGHMIVVCNSCGSVLTHGTRATVEAFIKENEGQQQLPFEFD